jgi:hypothetical protein
LGERSVAVACCVSDLVGLLGDQMSRTKQPAIASPQETREKLALSLRLKQLQGEPLNGKELGILDKWTRDFQASVLIEGLRNVPKNVYCQMAGRQRNAVDEFAARYDVAVGGPSIDLYAVLNALHTRVSELAAAARPYQDVDDAELQREKLRQEISKLQKQSESLQIDINTKLSELVPKRVVAERFEILTGRLRSLGAQLFRVSGASAQQILNEFLEALAKELDDGVLAF